MLDTVKINHVQHISFTQSRLTDAVSVILSELLSYEHPSKLGGSFYAADGGRTRTLSPERDFKSLVSANFTTAAYNANNNTIEWLLCQEKAQSPSLHPPFTIHL